MQITRLLLLALLPALATAQTAELAMQLADGSTLLSDPVGLGGGCTNCGVLPQSYALTTDRAAPPLLVAVSGAFSNAVLLAAYGSKDCTGPNSTSLFYEFTSDAVSIDTDSEFPSQINSFVMCVVK